MNKFTCILTSLIVIMLIIFVTNIESYASTNGISPPSSGSTSSVSPFFSLLFILSLYLEIRLLSSILEWKLNGYERTSFLLCTTFIACLWATYSYWFGGIFAGLSILIFIADNNRRKDFLKCRSIIEAHGMELAVKRKQLVISRGYGLPDERAWEKEKAFFLNNLVYPSIGRCTKIKSFQHMVSELFDEIVNSIRLKSADMNKNMTPKQYEQYVASILCEHGWDAETTKSSGDQGIDVVAIKKGIKVVIQCKLYSNAVGNSAVQEIIAGREFVKADFAAVVSNIKYTRPAKQLAASSGVFLLHDAELPELYSKIVHDHTN